MKKTSVVKRILMLLTALILILSLCCCDGGGINEPEEGVKSILSTKEQKEIEQAHAQMLAEKYVGYNAESKIEHYYGKYGDAYVVYITDGLAYICAVTGETAGGVNFIYPSSNTLWVYVEQEGFMKLGQAFGKGYLSKNDLTQIAKKHKEYFSYLYN